MNLEQFEQKNALNHYHRRRALHQGYPFKIDNPLLSTGRDRWRSLQCSLRDLKIREAHPNLVFLDLNLNDGAGYDLLHAAHPVGFKVIFISAFDRKTLQAFRLSNVAWLMKPFDPVEFIEAIKMAEESDVNDLSLCLEALEATFKEVNIW